MTRRGRICLIHEFGLNVDTGRFGRKRQLPSIYTIAERGLFVNNYLDFDPCWCTGTYANHEKLLSAVGRSSCGWCTSPCTSLYGQIYVGARGHTPTTVNIHYQQSIRCVCALDSDKIGQLRNSNSRGSCGWCTSPCTSLYG